MLDLTKSINLAVNGDTAALNRVFDEVFPRLQSIARGLVRRGDRAVTVEAAELADEIYLGLTSAMGTRANDAPKSYENRDQFFNEMTRAMRNVIIDYARKRSAQKRGGHLRRLSLDDCINHTRSAVVEDPDAMVHFFDCVEELDGVSPMGAKLVNLVCLDVLSMSDAIEHLGITEEVAESYWSHATSWLSAQIVKH